VLRKGTDDNKLAILYEVVAEDTSEEGTSQRRHGSEFKSEPAKKPKAVEKPKLKHRQLEIIPSSTYEVNRATTPKAAESPTKWGEEDTLDGW
jgi:hypothetical protein